MKSVKCNLCGADDWKIRFPATLPEDGKLNVDAFRCTSSGYGQHAQIVTCRQCDFTYANPRWDPDQVLAAYEAVEDDMYSAEREGRELTFSKHLQSMERFTGPAAGRSLLDVGAYIGVFVEVATAAGWQATGVEPSHWGVQQAHLRGLNVIEGTQDTLVQQGRRFDVVTMWDVIEHVDDPSAEIMKAFHLLKPGGIIAVHTMDIDSLMARLAGGRWPWLMDMHLAYFSQKTLAAMLEKAGFKILWSGVEGRYLRLGYLATRVGGMNKWLGRVVGALIRKLKMSEKPISVNFGDLFTVYAQRSS